MSKIFKKYHISEAVPDMILGKPIYSDTGKVIASEYTKLTPTMIDRLANFGVMHLYIQESITPNITKSNTIVFQEKHNRIVGALQNSFDKIHFFKEVPISEIRSLAEESLDLLDSTTDALQYLALADSDNQYILTHAVNVGVIAGVLGKWLKFDGFALKELVLAGFLHDIGKTQIPEELLNKADKLLPDEMEIVKKHALLGYELIKSSEDITESTKFAILQHHERLDGTGYPLRFHEDRISHIAQIISIADAYAAMTSNQPYRKAITPFEAIDELSEEMFSGKFNPSICNTFINHLQDSLIGIGVKLNDGQTAKVLYINKDVGARPIIETSSGEYINLVENFNLCIVEVVDI